MPDPCAHGGEHMGQLTGVYRIGDLAVGNALAHRQLNSMHNRRQVCVQLFSKVLMCGRYAMTKARGGGVDRLQPRSGGEVVKHIEQAVNGVSLASQTRARSLFHE
jgi:hypothetical protein